MGRALDEWRWILALWAVVAVLWAGLFWRNRTEIDWDEIGRLGVATVCLNKAILDLWMARLLRVVGHRSTAASLIAAASALLIGAGVITFEILELFDPAGWWWQPTLVAHLIAVGCAMYGMCVRLLMPVSSVAAELEREHVG